MSDTDLTASGAGIVAVTQRNGGVRDELSLTFADGTTRAVRVEPGACSGADALRRNVVYGYVAVISDSCNGMLIEHGGTATGILARLACRHLNN